MKKFLLTTVLMTLLFLITTNNAFTQPKQLGQAGANIGYNIPVGKFGDTYTGGINLGASLEYRLMPKFGVDFSLSYTSWKWDDLGAGSYSHGITSFTTLGILLGGRYYISNISGTIPYAGVDVGYYTSTTKFKFNDPTSSLSKFGFAVMGGAMIPINEQIYVNGFVDYTTILNDVYNITYIGIHAGVIFTFNMGEDEEE
jgi:opacity protein-like surface antigen